MGWWRLKLWSINGYTHFCRHIWFWRCGNLKQLGLGPKHSRPKSRQLWVQEKEQQMMGDSADYQGAEELRNSEAKRWFLRLFASLARDRSIGIQLLCFFSVAVNIIKSMKQTNASPFLSLFDDHKSSDIPDIFGDVSLGFDSPPSLGVLLYIQTTKVVEPRWPLKTLSTWRNAFSFPFLDVLFTILHLFFWWSKGIYH